MNTAKLSSSIYETAMYGGRIFQNVLNMVFWKSKMHGGLIIFIQLRNNLV